MKGVGVEIHLARVKYEVMELLEKDGADKNIGRDLIHNKVFEAVQWFTQKDWRVYGAFWREIVQISFFWADIYFQHKLNQLQISLISWLVKWV